MTNSPKNGDIVLVDLGMAAKVRPCLVISATPDTQRTVSIVAPLTSEVRGGESEVAFPKPPWLAKPCVVNLSGFGSVERHRIQRRLGQFPADRFVEVRKTLVKMLDLGPG
jgi:mRNA interferase MazF